jgi:hypothetical protein
MLFQCALLFFVAFISITLSQTDKCGLVADIAFLIDKSGSISNIRDVGKKLSFGKERIKIIKSFISRLTKSLPLGENGVRVVVASFNDKVTLYNNFNESSSYNYEQFSKVLNTIDYDSCDLETTKELYLALNKVNTGLLWSYNKIIVIFTAETPKAEKYGDPYLYSSFLRNSSGYKIVLFGIGDVTEDNMVKFTGSKKLFFNAPSFEAMSQQFHSFAETICNVNCEFTDWPLWGRCSPSNSQIWKRKITANSRKDHGVSYPLVQKMNCQRAGSDQSKKVTNVVRTKGPKPLKNELHPSISDLKEVIYKAAGADISQLNEKKSYNTAIISSIGTISGVILVTVSGITYYLKYMEAFRKRAEMASTAYTINNVNPIYSKFLNSKYNPATL